MRNFCRELFCLAAVVLLCVSARAAESLQPIKIDEASHTVSFPGRVAKLDHQDVLKGAIEYLIVMNGGKEYESIFVCPVDGQALYDALVKVGIAPGEPAHEENEKYVLPRGGRVRIYAEYKKGEELRRLRVEKFVFDAVNKKPMAEVDWVFTGSKKAKDPETGKDILQVMLVKNLVSMHHKDATVLLENPLLDARDDTRYHTNPDEMLKENTAVTIVIEAAPAVARVLPAGIRHIHLLVKGNVQGVGFRAFTQRSAKQLQLVGWVRNLPDGDVELEAEGPDAALKDFEEKVHAGPRGSKVDKVEELKSVNTDEFSDFEIRGTPEK